MKELIKTDFCILGAGTGGLSFAAGASQMGASVVLVEHRKMGGDCLNYGCVPSKSLIAAANIGYDLKKSADFGWLVNKPTVDFLKVHDYVQGVIKAIAPHDSVERFESLGVRVILEEGQFVDSATLETNRYLIQPKRFIISTGSSPFVPPIEGLSNVSYYTNESIFDLKELPTHLAVIGGGPIGIEMAQAFHRLGSKVTVLEAFDVLPKDDPEMTSKLKTILIQEGIEIKEQIKIVSVRQTNAGIEFIYKNQQEEKITVSHVLVATGRKANVEHLNLEAAQINASPKGILVNKYLRTSNPKAYAIGDCTGGYQFTHVAAYHAGLAIRNSIFRLRTAVQVQAIPWVTYTDPELAHVGFLEAQLKSQKIPYQMLSMHFDENDRAHTENRTEGMIKVSVSPKGYVLGATILGLHAGELIYPWVLAIQNRLKIESIANSIVPYPTLNDISKRIAGSYFKDKIFSPGMKKIVRFLMKL